MVLASPPFASGRTPVMVLVLTSDIIETHDTDPEPRTWAA
jgi:hypothetical protein